MNIVGLGRKYRNVIYDFVGISIKVFTCWRSKILIFYVGIIFI